MNKNPAEKCYALAKIDTCEEFAKEHSIALLSLNQKKRKKITVKEQSHAIYFYIKPKNVFYQKPCRSLNLFTMMNYLTAISFMHAIED